MINFHKFFKNLFSEECLNCGKNGKLICEICLENLENSKIRNKNKVPALSYSQLIDYKNTEYINNINWISSPYSFQHPLIKKSLYILKYNYVKNIAKYLAKLTYTDFYDFLKIIKKDFSKNNENIILIPIPISKKRLIKRNYNQSEVLLKAILEIIKVNCDLDLEKNIYTDLLLKNKHTMPFSEADKQDIRLSLIKDAFSINKKYPKEFFENKTIVLFDDITTTGATFYEARKTLAEAEVKKENIFAFAIAH